MQNLIQKMKRHYKNDFEILKKAFDYSREAHAGQKRASGEEYFIHPVAVADILIDLGLDSSAVAASLLHDVIEDTPRTEDDITELFGEEICELVKGVTKLDKLEFVSKEHEQAENFRKMCIAMTKDLRVILIKLADRVHNMRSLSFLSPVRQKAIATETLEIYAPLASRFGISNIKCELEDLCFKHLNPEAYHQLAEDIDMKKTERLKIVEKVVEELEAILKDIGIEGEVVGRPKHLYSIYKKMLKQNKSIEQIYDLTAVRILLHDTNDCYKLLGAIHGKWKPMPGRIKDYIATSKANGYQSLHTTVATNYGQPFEIQIRTFQMHRIAEYGIAAHWKYKEGQAASSNFEQVFSLIREIADSEGSLNDATEFLNSVKGDIFSGEVVVFSPRGDVIALPAGSSPIDFAYHIHSEIGNKCVGAKINQKIVPLSTALENGDTVEILTSNSSKGPSSDWFKIVKTASAKSKIRLFFRKNYREENIKRGKSMVEREAKRRGYNLSDLVQVESLDAILSRYSIISLDEAYSSIGYGAFTTNQLLIKLIDAYENEHKQEKALDVINDKVIEENKPTHVVIDGNSDFLMRFAGCCSPVPGDDIVGFISRGRGVMIHRKDCPNIKNIEVDRLIEACWSGSDVQKNYASSFQVEALNGNGILNSVIQTVALMKVEILKVNARTSKDDRAIITMSVSIKRASELDAIMNKIKQDRNVLEIYRI